MKPLKVKESKLQMAALESDSKASSFQSASGFLATF